MLSMSRQNMFPFLSPLKGEKERNMFYNKSNLSKGQQLEDAVLFEKVCLCCQINALQICSSLLRKLKYFKWFVGQNSV